MTDNLNLRNNQKSAIAINLDGRNHILAPPKPCTNALLSQTAYLLSKIEVVKYKSVGQKAKSKEYTEIKSYFNSTANKIAYGSLIYKYYFDNKLLKKSIVSKELQITAKAASDMVNECIEAGYVIALNRKEHIASPLFTEAYLSYVKEQLQFMLPHAENLVAMGNATKLSLERKKYDTW